MLRASPRAWQIQSTKAAWSGLTARIRATEHTWRRWRGTKVMRACEGLALHHHCDPDALGMWSSASRAFSALHQEFSVKDDEERYMDQLVSGQHDPTKTLTPSEWLHRFCMQLASLEPCLRYGRCVERAEPVEDSLIRVADLLESIGDWPVLAFPDTDALRLEETQKTKCYPRRIQAVLDAHDFNQTVAQGGQYVPGDPATYRNPIPSLRERYPEMSPTMLADAARFAKPEDLPLGRPRKQKPAGK